MTMKWPAVLTLIRHDVSLYNELRGLKSRDSRYLAFLEAYGRDPASAETRLLAQVVQRKFALGVSDARTPLAEPDNSRAIQTGARLRAIQDLPDVVYLSPYLRARDTYNRLCLGWPELAMVSVIEDERLREQEHGLSTLYNDWRVFFAMHPEQRLLYEQDGSYWYRYPQGENVPDVRLRNNIWIGTLIREFAGLRVLCVTHHLTILATRANLERLTDEQFIQLDHEQKPINLGVTTYLCDPNVGHDGRLVLSSYNQALWS